MVINEETVLIQKELLELLKKFHDICINYGIKYTLHGGTLLGAIREKGFIPWDDDVDVAFTRDEYIKFSNAIKNANLGSDLLFDEYGDKTPRLIMKSRYVGVVWIDIFIYDYISSNRLIQKIKVMVLILLTAFSKTKHTIRLSEQRKNERKFFQRVIFNFVYLLGRPFGDEFKYKLLHKFSYTCFLGTKQLIHRSNDQFRGIGVNGILPKEFMDKFELCTFEDSKLMISASAHEMLINFYGLNYMEPVKPSLSDNMVHDELKQFLIKVAYDV